MLNRLSVPAAWVVKCTGCGCTINARAIDSQTEANLEKPELAPKTAMMVTCACCCGCYRYSPHDVFKRMPQPNDNCRYWKARLELEDGSAKRQKEPNGAVVVAATLTAAMLLREELKNHEIKPVPR